MNVPRISASSYSNTAPLIWSFLYGSMHGHVEIILDNAPARSAELLAQGRVDAALVPVIAYQSLPDVRLVPGVCVGAKEKVLSVALITRGMELEDVRSVSLDTSSKTSVALSKILFREFLGFEPQWRDSPPNIEAMLDQSDCALLIGDPALSIADRGSRVADLSGDAVSSGEDVGLILTGSRSGMAMKSEIRTPQSAIRKFDLAELWRRYTGLGFVFAMWMTRVAKSPVAFAAARDEGVERIDEIVSNYLPDIKISEEDFRTYLSRNISYKIDEELERGMRLYFDLAKKHRLCENVRELDYAL
jgi:chorismate dehydratase